MTHPLIDEQVTHAVRYWLTWKPDFESSRKVACFPNLVLAEQWYYEKLAEGKDPLLWKKETITTIEALLPQEES